MKDVETMELNEIKEELIENRKDIKSLLRKEIFWSILTFSLAAHSFWLGGTFNNFIGTLFTIQFYDCFKSVLDIRRTLKKNKYLTELVEEAEEEV